MAFLARQLALRCTDIPEIGSPTILLIVDRDDLQKQGAKLFTKSKEFLNLGEVKVVPTRKILREELGAREEDIEKMAWSACHGDVCTGYLGGFVALDKNDVENIYLYVCVEIGGYSLTMGINVL